MYYACWGLARSPFTGYGASLFFHGESQAEALARLRFAASERRSAVLLGVRGVGKTALGDRFASQCAAEGRTVLQVNLAGLSPRELLWRIVGGLSLGPRPDDDAAKLQRRLDDALLAPACRHDAAVLLLDDADQAGPDMLSPIRRLAWLGAARGAMTLILAATPHNCHRLGEGLLDALDLRVDLEPWSESDATGYIQYALVEAGGDRPVFDEDALSTLYSLTEGVPRRVNRLADHALLGAAAEGRPIVDAAMIEAAHDALSWTATV